MNVLIVFGILILTFVRLIGIIVSVDFYYDLKSNTYIYLTFAWSLWFFSGIFALLYQLESNRLLQEIFLFMNYLFGPLSLLFLLAGLSSYYLKISPNKILYVSIILIITPFIVYITLGLIFVSIYSRIIIFFIFLILFLLPNFKFKKFKEKIGRSIRWYYVTFVSIAIYIPIQIFLFIGSNFYGIYTSENVKIIIIGYVSIILTTILIIAYTIHLEYNITYEQKKELKDKYSHDLGNILQAIEFSHFLSISDNNLNDEDLKETHDIIKKKFKEASETLKKIRKL